MQTQQPTSRPMSNTLALVLAWLFVGVPIGWGVFNTARQATLLFHGTQSTPPVVSAVK